MNTDREEFLAGQRPSDVHVFLDEDAVGDLEALEPHGERVENGIVLVMDGEQARDVFRRTTGIDPMAFAQEAMGTVGTVTEDCTAGTCPDGESDGHAPEFIFAFAEEQNEEVGGIYADGPVIHAYVACECGTRYSDKWTA